jgi:hypothetical protein
VNGENGTPGQHLTSGIHITAGGNGHTNGH